MDENHTVKSGLTPLLKLFEKEYFYLRKLHSQIWVLKSGLLKPGLPVQFQMWDNTNIIQLSFKKYPFSCTNPCFRCFCRSLYVCKYISEGFPFCSIFLSWLKKKNILPIRSTLHILAHNLRLLSSHSESLFSNFDNLPVLNILPSLCFFL